jgi:hypothetical protein
MDMCPLLADAEIHYFPHILLTSMLFGILPALMTSSLVIRLLKMHPLMQLPLTLILMSLSMGSILATFKTTWISFWLIVAKRVQPHIPFWLLSQNLELLWPLFGYLYLIPKIQPQWYISTTVREEITYGKKDPVFLCRIM